MINKKLNIFTLVIKMEDTLSFEDMAIECKPFEPSYTEEFRQYMQKSIEESRKAHVEAVQSISNIIITL